ncbi:Uncharacterised protein [Vibrio cholerae]|nr:Uncharacterised protein [Vibrio cholerae]CSI55505.1 Uncharacterised protein [Vibrio cholerae]
MANSKKASQNGVSHASSISGRVNASETQAGVAPIAAKSLMFDAKALCATQAGLA